MKKILWMHLIHLKNLPILQLKLHIKYPIIMKLLRLKMFQILHLFILIHQMD